MSTGDLSRVRVLVNRRSGTMWSFDAVQAAFHAAWEAPRRDISYQFLYDVDDGIRKARRAIEDGVDTVVAVGGDGTVSSIGRELVGTPVCLGTIPTGSGNGLARHFGVPLHPPEAVRALAKGHVRSIDVGLANERPFLITCSMAWDAAIVRSFDKMPLRGFLPYVFAGVYEFFEYRPQPFSLEVDGAETIEVQDPFVCTVANLSQYGGGAKIAPQARPDDGQLELIIARKQHAHVLIANLGRLMNGSITDLPQVVYRRFSSLNLKRANAAPIQIDGELVDCGTEVAIRVSSRALKILVPSVAPPPATA